MGNVPEGAKEKELQELFAAFGELEEVALMRGYGFVVSEKRALYLEFETDSLFRMCCCVKKIHPSFL